MMQENKKIEEILNSLQRVQQPESNPFMLTRILAKAREAEATTIWTTIFKTLQRPVVAFSLVLFVLVINSFFFYNNSRRDFDLSNTTATATTLKPDFNLEFTSIYDIENTEQ